MRAGAQYADARVTRKEQHHIDFRHVFPAEQVGVGVRALVDGYWGFAARPSGTTGAVEQLAREAVTQASVNARDTSPRTVNLGSVPPAAGRWSTPATIDPFTVPIEEKHAFLRYWNTCAQKSGLAIDVVTAYLRCTREERAVATSAGGRFTQTVYESGGNLPILAATVKGADPNVRIPVRQIETTGRGWEVFLNANIPEQLHAMPPQFVASTALARTAQPATVGRYTLVCDGATMAAILSATIGIATQLDRALGYEANAGGTSFITDPLAMLGTFQLASPLVTVMANRSAPAQLATVKWDDEGVVPDTWTLVKDGVLADFQTTREQAAWLASYYTKVGQPVRSHGCAAAESALAITLQHTPNLALEPGPASIHLEDLVANVSDGILLEQGTLFHVDAQARNGLLYSPMMRRIKNGRLGALLTNGVVQFNTLDLWKNVTALGGPPTQMVVPFSQYPYGGADGLLMHLPVKGQPPQLTSHSVQAVAATIANQPVINPERKA
jgi:TldD protein